MKRTFTNGLMLALCTILCVSISNIANGQWTSYNGVPIAFWDFEDAAHTSLVTTPAQQINTGNTFDGKVGGATATVAATGNGVTYTGSAGVGLQAAQWPTVSVDPGSAATHYFQFSINTSGFTGISVGMDIFTGITAAACPNFGVLYSTNGGTTWVSGIAGITGANNTWFSGQLLTLPAAADNNANLKIRIYGYAGKLNANSLITLDNFTVLATGTTAGTVKTLLNELSLYTSNTSGLTGSAWYRNSFTATGAGTNITVNNSSGIYMGASQTFAVTSGATVTFGNTAIVGGTGLFSIASGCTLATANTSGINAVGTGGGSVISTGGRTYNAGANYIYNGTSAQVTGNGLPSSLVSPSALTINNSAGVTLSQSTATTGTLTLTSGILNTGTFVMAVPGAAGAITGANSARYINGTLQKTINGLSSLTYEVGDANYAPVTVALSSAGTGGSIGVRSSNGLHPNAATSALYTTQVVNHYWTITTPGAAGPASISPTFTYNAGDILGGSNTTFVSQRYNGSTWLGSSLAATNTVSPYTSAPTAAVALGAAAADYIFGNQAPPCVAPTPGPLGPIGFPIISSIGGSTSFTNATSSPTGYIVVASSGALLGTPAAATSPVAGTACCTNGTIVGVGSSAPVTMSGLSPNTTYNISLFAYNLASCSGGPVYNTTSPTAGTLLTCPTTPGTPVNGTITGSSIATSWAAPSGGASSYTVQVYTDASLTTPAVGYSVSYAGTTAMINGLSGLTQYWYNVFANNSSCSSSPSASQTGTTLSGPCAGIPTGGAATSTSSLVGPSGSFTLGLSGASGASGITYQWQSSSCLDTWTNITGANSSTLTTTQSAATNYRCVLTCSSSGLSAQSSPVYVGYVSSAYCSMNTIYSCTDDVDGVTQFILSGACGTSINESTISCFDNLLDHTSMVIKFYPGTTYSGGSIKAGYSGDNGAVWIDLNDDGNFDASERLWAGSGISNTTASSVSLTIPAISASVKYGVHRMRVAIYYSVTKTQGCNSIEVASYGNAVDYTVQIVPNPSLSNNSPVCSGSAVTLTATPSVACGAIYSWAGPSGYTAITNNVNSVSPAATAGTYSVSMTVNGATSCASATSNVITNPLPTAFSITGGGSYCTGGTGVAVGLSGSQTGVNYQLKNGAVNVGSAVAGTGAAISFGNQSTATTYTVVATNTTTSCTNNMTGSATVSINPLPTAVTASGTGTFCGSTSISASNGGSGTIYYQGNTTNGTSTALGGTPQTVTTTGTYYFRPQSAAGCWGTQGSVAVTINPLPDVSNFSTTASSQCLGAASTTTVTTTSLGNGTYTVTYNLSGANTSIGNSASLIIASNTGTFTIPATSLTIAGATTITITSITNGLTCSNSPGSGNSATFNVNAIPAPVTATGGGTFCGSTNISASNGGDGTIYYQGASFNGTSTLLGGSPQTVSATNTYYFRAQSAAGCWSPQGSVAVTVNPLPAATTVSGGGTFCGNTTITASGGTGGTIYFQGTTSGGASTATPSTSAVVSTSGIYYFRSQTSIGCWGPEGSVAVTINPVPAAAPTNDGHICIGGTVNLAANPTGGATVFTWSGVDLTATNIEHPTANPTVTATYSLTVSDGSGNPGCSPTTIYTTTVTVNAVPTATPSNSGPICVGGTVTLTANPADGANTYSWSGSSLSSSTEQNPTATPTANEVYSLTVSDGSGHSGCSSTTAYATSVSVNPAPSLTSATNDGPMCEGTTLNLTANGAANVTGFSWTGPVAITSAATAAASIPSAATTASGIYSVTVNNNIGSGCAVTYTTSATVNALPTVAGITPSSTNLCIGASLTLTAGAVNGSGTISSYNWSGPNGFSTTTSGNTATLTLGSTLANGIYTLSVTYPGTNCSSGQVTSGAIAVNDLPTVSGINVSPSILCANNPITLTGSGATGSGSLVSYNWTGPNSYTSTSASATHSYTVPDASASGVYSLSVTYTGTGCTSTLVASNTLTVDPLPTPFNITGGGFYCVGGSGVHVGTDGSETGINYQLYNGSSAVGTPIAGTGAALDFGLQTAAGTYSVVATNTATSCTNAMNGTTAVTINTYPVVYTVTGGGSYCAGDAGVHIGLSNSEASVGYQVYRGATAVTGIISGTGGAMDFGLFTTAGTYTVVGNPSATCAENMAGSATVGIYPLPTQYNVNGGGDYCIGGVGVHIGLNWSVTGVSYQLYNGATPVGSPVVGAASGLDFGLQTAAGTYTVLATNLTTSCINSMTSNATVVINPLPAAFTVTGGGNYCAGGIGSAVGLSGSNTGINYQLFLGSSPVGSAVAGTGSSISLGNQQTAGTYTVSATDATTSCTSSMTGSATVGINPAPATFAVTGGGSYCAGGVGKTIGLAGSATGVNYQLYNGTSSVGSQVAGTGSALNFGLQTAAGTYTVLATITATSCTGAMTGSAAVSIDPLPAAYAVTGGGVYCSGGAGVVVGLSNSAVGINYRLYKGATSIGSPVAGNGSAISFGNQTVAGTYTVLATNVGTSCTNPMSGSAVIGINPTPVIYNMTGGGSYCVGGAGVAVGLSSSTLGIDYQLYLGTTAVGSSRAGSGIGIDFGMQVTAGTYTVQATNTVTGCTVAMSGGSVISINALPTVYNITGGGSYCTGGSGQVLGMAGSTTVDVYQLYRGSTPVGATVAGTGSAISFGVQTSAGTYTVAATTSATGCANNMGGSATISVNPLPTAFSVGGGGAYCIGGSGAVVNLSSSTIGINYQLYQGGTAVGSPVSGTGSAIDFGFKTAGTYSVAAVSASTTCANNMSGSAIVIANPLPTVYAVTGGGSYCSGGAGVTVGLSNSQAGVSYQLYRGATAIGSPIPGSGSAISFGAMSVIGSYSVVATNVSTGCVSNMSGNAAVSVNALPTAFNVIGGGSYCAGGTGVSIGTNNSASGVNYQLYLGSTAVGTPVAGSTGTGVSFGTFTNSGTYTVMATASSTGCAAAMSGSASVNISPLPTTYSVTGGGSYCNGGGGVAVGLSSSTTGVNYQLYNGSSPVGSAIAGTGSALLFGSFTPTGTYTVAAINATTSCTSNMTGNAVISINPSPSTFTVTGGGTFCNGSAGVSVGLNGSTSGANYQLYSGSSALGSPVAGTGSTINFGTFNTAGVYTVSAVNTSTGCAANMAGSATISINATPVTYNVSGGGSYCNGGSGVNIGLDGTTAGVNYQLYNGSSALGSPVAGTGGPVNFGSQTTAGTYTVFATNVSTGCAANMTNSATVVVNALPATFSVTGGGSYCSGGSGVAVGLAGSSSGVNYQLFRGTVAMSAQVPGTGGAMTFGPMTAAGTYTVVATDASTTCTGNMPGNAVVSINASPAVFSITGGGSYCTGGSGKSVGLSNSASGVNYTLYNGSTAVGSAIAGTGLPISFGPQLTAGTYTVAATSTSSSCGANMTGSALVTVNNLPAAYTVTGGGVYCAGSSGAIVGLSNSANGVNYQLFNSSSTVGTAVPGTGGAISFGMQTGTGTYSVVATNASTGCVNNMNGTVAVNVTAQPVAYNVTGGGAFCAGGTGVSVGLNSSNSGISYQLYNGSVASGTPIIGTGTAISFDNITAAGAYSIVATNVSTGCTNAMNGTAAVIVNPMPTAYAVAGGGNYCVGGVGVDVSLSGSSLGINYQLYNGSSLAGAAVAGTGGAIDFGSQVSAGNYTVRATDATTLCSADMTGSTSVGVNALPAVYTMTGGGNYCAGGTGSIVSLGNSESNVSYQLYRGGTAVGVAVAGTGAPISFGSQLVAGVYSVSAVNALTGCSRSMSGTASVGINVLPAVYAVSGGGNYCVGGTGVNITLSGSSAGVNYNLFNGSTATGSVVGGSGSGITFGLQTAAGTYTVQAINATTGCISNMSSSATVATTPLPTAYTLTGGGNYCAGGSGVAIGLSNSNTGIFYQLFKGATAASAPIPGTGSPLDFGTQAGGGTYSVVATDNTTGCVNAMTGSAVVTPNALPLAYNVMGGGSYCPGGTGVSVSLSNSTSGINYQLYNGSTAVGAAIGGTGSAISFGSQTAAGSYSVMATNTSTGCSGGMTGIAAVMINSLPAVYNVTGGGSYCSGGSGVAIGLENSTTGTIYQLYSGATAVGSPMAGTGSAISFGPQMVDGTYSVSATNNATGCNAAMTGTATISINALPDAYVVGGGGNYCAGGTGVHILLFGSNTGVDYQVYRGATAVGSAITGTGAAIDLGEVLPAGTYTVLATDAATSCNSAMTGSAAVNINAGPAAFSMTGGGNYCAGSGGATIGLTGSESGISYQLYMGSTAVGSPVIGTGSAISFGLQPAAGTYVVLATNTVTGCNSSMNGIATVAISPLPVAYTVTGGGNYCAGTPGVHVGISGSSTTDRYQLYNGTSAIGSPILGTGAPIDFGIFNATGTYSVVALNSTMTCGRNMTGTASIGVNALPTVYAISGGGGYCVGGTGVHVGMANTATGINYQLYNGSTVVGTAVAGTGTPLDFGLVIGSGAYTVLATNSTTGCSRSMSGTAMVVINSLPTAFSVTGGGTYCESGSGVEIGLSSSTSGVNYQLYNAGSPLGTSVAGTGSAVTFGLQTLPGAYTVMAISTSTTCTRPMTGSASVSITPAVVPSVSITKSTSADTICQGTSVTFSAVAINGGTTPVYQWSVNGSVVGTASSYSYAPANHDIVTATVTSSAACVLPATVSHSVTMTVNTAFTPAISVSLSTSDTVCSGTSVTCNAVPSHGGTAPVIAWMKNGINVGSGTTYTYVPSNGDVVYCGMISNYACRTVTNVSSVITNMVVNEAPVPVVSILANPGTSISKGQMVSFTATVTNGGANPTYHWKQNGFAVTGATNSTFSGNGFNNNDVISCDVTSNSVCGSATSSDKVTLVVSTLDVINVAATNIDVNVMPNPNKGEFSVKGDLATKDNVEVTLEVVNMLGQTVYSNKVMANQGSINERIKLDNSLSNGMYMLNLRSAAGSKVFHVVVEQ